MECMYVQEYFEAACHQANALTLIRAITDSRGALDFLLTSVKLKHLFSDNMFVKIDDKSPFSWFSKKNATKTFKEKKTFEQRVAEVEEIKHKFSNKVPIIVERHRKDRELPELDKSKFLVPSEISVGQFISILRTRLRLPPPKSLFLLIDGQSLGEFSSPLGAVYEVHHDEDGFLYVNYAAQEAFG